MPDLIVEDPDAVGVCDVHTHASQVEVLGDRLYIEVITGTDVTIKGTPFDDTGLFIRMRLEWNGGSVNPTILDTAPVGFDEDGNYSLGYSTGYEWLLEWSYGAKKPSSTIYVTNITGSSFNQVVTTGFNDTSPVSQYGFEMRLNGTPVLPADGDFCTIVIVAIP